MVGTPHTPVSVRAELDVPGETGRQAKVGAIWGVCLLLAVCVGVLYRARDEADVSRSRADRLKVALVLGLLLPTALTFALNRRHRRGGGHARGIVVDVTDEGELRLWGRGYGTRIRIEGASISERLVDVYAGRLGAWRQRRMRIRGGDAARSSARDLELSTAAVARDADEGLRVEGGEGDCVELDREGYESVRAVILARNGTAPARERVEPKAPQRKGG
jgi:hypothetical protein